AEPDLGDRCVGRGDRPGGRLRRDAVAEVSLDASACREPSDVLADGAVIDGGPTFDPPFAREMDEAVDRVTGPAASDVAPLLRQAEAGDAPALAGGADHVLRRHHDVVEEHLVEVSRAGDLAEGPSGDAGGAHVEDERGDARR